MAGVNKEGPFERIQFVNRKRVFQTHQSKGLTADRIAGFKRADTPEIVTADGAKTAGIKPVKDGDLIGLDRKSVV